MTKSEVETLNKVSSTKREKARELYLERPPPKVLAKAISLSTTTRAILRRVHKANICCLKASRKEFRT